MKKTFVPSLVIAISFLLSGCASQTGLLRPHQLPFYNESIVLHSARYISLARFCDYYNLEWDWDLVSQKIEIRNPGNTVVLRPASNLALINGRPFELNYPVEYKEGAAYLSIRSAQFFLTDVFGFTEIPAAVPKAHRIETIVIDPGHGGKDPGAVSRRGAKEKDIVLDISRRLKEYLHASGARILITRDKDVFIPLYQRAEFANKNNANFFISVHANASKHSSLTRGLEVYYLSDATDNSARALEMAENESLKFEKSEITRNQDLAVKTTLWDLKLDEARRQSKELAYYICNITSENLSLKKGGVKGARFAVLKGAHMPAVLIEVGYLTNKKEESRLQTSAFRDEVAKALLRSVIMYKREYDRTNGFSK